MAEVLLKEIAVRSTDSKINATIERIIKHLKKDSPQSAKAVNTSDRSDDGAAASATVQESGTAGAGGPLTPEQRLEVRRISATAQAKAETATAQYDPDFSAELEKARAKPFVDENTFSSRDKEAALNKEREILARKYIPGEVIDHYMKLKHLRVSLRDAATQLYKQLGDYNDTTIQGYVTKHLGTVKPDKTPMTIDDYARGHATKKTTKGKPPSSLSR